ncbi:potassium transporter KefB [Chitinophaga sp. SYP-B3965]|uniref:potassium transporter KefB n=1 Tax=Chitinophaga sp. SYP-B3965 TaxID=2663120 RepID=UPI001299BDD7|nr:potassium transporter KefB [Chitinophaga sp. SYP-B3965]MRG45252.1 potassium transporter KefB [Chitinophaga sp. SYP-B3965]
MNSTTSPIHSASLSKCMLIGGGIALVLITALLLTVNNPSPNWPKYWMIRPLIIVPLAGATGGACYYFLDHLRYQGGWKKVLAYILSFLVYLIGLWMGTILGLDGTLWD